MALALPEGRCISFDSYIKPQLASCCFGFLKVVYLLIPTSNHNSHYLTDGACKVVYLLIPTSNHNNHNAVNNSSIVVYLLIPTSNHNRKYTICFFKMLYIF